MNYDSFRERYGPWLAEVRPLLEQADWKTSFRTYPYVVSGEIPWSPFSGDASRSKVALLSTAGLYMPGEQPRFKAEDIEGDWTFRELPGDVTAERLEIAHDHYNHGSALRDLNSVFPLERLREMAAEGAIGAVAERHYSVSGYCTRADLIAERTAPAIAESVKAEGVDVVLHVPV